MKKTNIYEYTDYRLYLKDVFNEHKQLNHTFSHRFAAFKLGLSTSNFLWLVMQGKRNLNQTLCLKLCDLFKLSPKESDYFENMVNFTQAKTHREKDRYFSRMMVMRKNSSAGKIDERLYSYLSNWHNAVIREIVTQKGFKKDFAKLAKRVTPRITESQARKSFQLLLELGLIKEKGGHFVQSPPVISTGPEVTSVAAMNFHKNLGHLAIESLDSHNKDERNVTACIVGLSKESYKQAVDAIAECRGRLLSIAEAERNPAQVFAVNFQCFPVSTEEKEE
ncbi:MAG TPA: TIGR02147 family protein [Chitinivibrionales bacterium]|nr:TIGR02147 family protein [Chitinivibrionales bacterium]